MKENKFSIIKRLNSFLFAFNGLRLLFREEHNSRIHLIAAIIVIALGSVFELKTYEWVAILFSIGLVVTVEIINTSIENIADFISPQRNEKIKVIKDLSAAAVLVSSITAIIIGLIIFLPKISAWWG